MAIDTADTGPKEDGSADLQHVLDAARNIGRQMEDFWLIIDKSTVQVGMAAKEGAAVGDFMRPDRVVLGVGDERAREMLREIYLPLIRNHDRVLMMDTKSAEFTKYAANAMLATRISFVNELSSLADRLGADIKLVRKGIGSESRIGFSFLYAGCGYEGSCFAKGIEALVRTGREQGLGLTILHTVEHVNEMRKVNLLDKITTRFGEDLSGRRFAV